MKTAYRWAREHNIELVMLRRNENITFTTSLSNRPVIDKTIGFGDYSMESNQGALLTNRYSCNSAMMLKNFSSQQTKEVAAWHEIGHYVDITHGHTPDTMPILKYEARASEKAIKLMKKFNRWNEGKRELLLGWYDMYISVYPHQKSYRHLIERA